MPTIMDEIRSVLRQDHFEIQNTKEKQQVSYKRSRIRPIICFQTATLETRR